MTKNIKLNIVNASELDPEKRYVIELPTTSYTKEDTHDLAEVLDKLGIVAVVTMSQGKDSIKVKQVPKKKGNK